MSQGVTLAPRANAQVVAPAAGRVAFSVPYRGYGQIVIIEHAGGWSSLVTGLARSDVSVGEQLVDGAPIGVAGPGWPGYRASDHARCPATGLGSGRNILIWCSANPCDTQQLGTQQDTRAMKFAPKFAPAIRAAALCTAVALLPATTAAFAQVEGRASPEFAKLFATYQRIKSSYVEPVDDEQLIRGAIDGMLASLDPHSSYIDGAAMERLNTMIDGNYQGLGISIQMDDGLVKVVSPFRGSPADQAGIKAGDYISHVNGKLIYGLEINEAVEQMRGPAGTDVQVTILRAGRDEPMELTVTRGVIELEPVTWEMKDGDIGHISVNEFSRDVGADVNAAIADLRMQARGGLKGLVLDLRRNPGGSLDEAVALSDLFLDEGQIVSQRGRGRRDTIYYDAESVYRGDVAEGLPIVVLIDEGSASASEIVAGALQDHQRALIMGERSFGKGSVQTLLPLTRDTALKLTTARYYTPSGRSVQEGGIEPDIRVPQLSDPDAERRQRYAMRESDLRGHLVNEIAYEDKSLERDQIDDPRFAMTAEQLEEQGIDDFQLQYALDTLRRTNGVAIAARAGTARRN